MSPAPPAGAGPRAAARVVLATRNAAKLIELRRILAATGPAGTAGPVGDTDLDIEVLGLGDVADYPEPPETGATFEENALTKARAAAEATGLPAVADDSGLAVDALGGMPGVLSARWAGRHGDDDANLHLVLGQLADVPAQRRGAAFVCAAALVTPSGVQTVVRGEWRGTLTTEPRGRGGFGYDPIFVPEGERRTSAELAPEEKDAASHRGRALRALLPALRRAATGP